MKQPYFDQHRRLKDRSVLALPPHSQELLDRVRQPSTECILIDEAYWVRTCYESSSEEYWAEIQSHLNAKLGRPAICNDPSLYNFGSYWEKIFLRLPQLLDIYSSAEEYENDTQEGLHAGIEAEDMDAQIAEENGYRRIKTLGHPLMPNTTCGSS